jgi:hyperosmotically inducible periplasmic protein
MKLRTFVAIASIAALAGVAGCDRPSDERAVSRGPSPAAPPQSTPSPAMPSQSPSAGLPPATAEGGDRTAGQVVDDAGITAKVKAALIAEKDVNGMSINVDTAGGKVTLTGKVPDQAQIDKAIQIARAVDGVKSVDNKLTVGAG